MGKGQIASAILKQKLEQAHRKLEEFSIDLWVTFVQETSSGAERVFSYISPGHLTWESAITVTGDGRKEVICGSLDKKDFEDSGLFDRVNPYVADFKEPFIELLKTLSPKKIALNYSFNDASADGISYGKYIYLEKLIKEHAPGAEIVSAEHVIGSLVSQKSGLELEAIREAVGITVKLFDDVSAFLKVGQTELQVYDFVQQKIAAAGTTPSFTTLVFAGDRGEGMGHSSATDNDIRHGDVVHVDMGVWVRGYASDMQRTWYVLKPGESAAPEAVIKGFSTIVKSIDLSAKALKPGLKGIDIDVVARKAVTDAGFPEYPHALGHQLGQHVHDGGCLLGPAWPRYKQTPFLPVMPGQVFTLEPSLNVKGHGSIGLEDDWVVNDDGCEPLAEPQREIWYIKG